MDENRKVQVGQGVPDNAWQCVQCVPVTNRESVANRDALATTPMTARKAYLWVNTAGSFVLRLEAFSTHSKFAPIVNDLFLKRLVGG